MKGIADFLPAGEVVCACVEHREEEGQVHTEIGALDLRHGERQHLALVGGLSVQTIGLAWPGAAGTAGALLGRGLADGRHYQRVHANLGVVHLQWQSTYSVSAPYANFK